MADVALLVLFIALPIAIWLVSRSLAWTAVALTFAFGLAGNAMQSLISLGMAWSTRGVQGLAAAAMACVLAVAVLRGRNATGRSLRPQVVGVLVPALAIGLFLILMRLLAPGGPSALSAVGYLVNHPQAEDNAKWLHLTAQLADGQTISFNGYAGGPLLLVMAVMAALISVLSMALLGGVNEVAVAANTLIGTQFLLIALVPFVFAPYVERRVRPLSGDRQRLPWPLVGIAMLLLAIASSVVTSYGHLSLQFVLLVLVLWSATFLMPGGEGQRLMMTLAIATTASVWLPFNVLGLLVLILTLVWVIRRRSVMGAVLWAATVLASWDALISSTLFLLGIGQGSGSSSESVTSTATDGGASIQSQILGQVETAKSLFTAPGGVEQIQPITAVLAIVSVFAAAWLLGRRQPAAAVLRRFGPITLMAGYLLLVQVGDAISTGAAPHYGGHKLGFAVTVMALASTLPIALLTIDGGTARMTGLRWLAVGGVVVLMTLDTMLPRSISALSPMLWPSIDRATPAYWSGAEVKPIAEQPISSLPIACVFTPQGGQPTGLPRGQQAYGCTRLLLGLSGLEGDATVLATWLQTDWLSNETHWDDFRDRIATDASGFEGRRIIVMREDGSTAGLTTLGELLARYPVAPSP